MPNINVPQKNLVLKVADGENLMAALQNADIPVASSCLGEGICSMCKMKVLGVSSKPSDLETRTLLRNKVQDPEVRLSCQIQVVEDLTVETTYW
jgi:2Fe-2S ferredoxin